jgi:translation initiation factor 4A
MTENVIIEKEVEKWDEFGLPDNLLRGIYAYGFETPSNIQKKAILPILQKRDLIAQAQSGCGKTGTFAIGSLHRINIKLKNPQVLILSPTHELVKQTVAVIEGLGSFIEGLSVKSLVGGTSIRHDVEYMKEHRSQIIVGTVGRVLDMIEKKLLKTTDLDLLVIDEADVMLSEGFSDKIRIMFEEYFPRQMQVVLFSATMPLEIISLTKRFMNNPVSILMKNEELSLQCIQQFYVAVQNDYVKYEVLKDLFSVISVSQCIIYCNSVRRVEELCYRMVKDDFSVCCIHSNMDKTERMRIFKLFREGGTRVLVSSDITARGIDVQQVSTVINFDLTPNVHTYLHRIGRGGRWGRKGFAINFITKSDIPDVKRIENYYKIDIKELPSDFKGQV